MLERTLPFESVPFGEFTVPYARPPPLHHNFASPMHPPEPSKDSTVFAAHMIDQDSEHPGQFLIAAEPFAVPEHYKVIEASGLFLAVAPDVPINRIVNSRNEPQGYLLGIPVDLRSESVIEGRIQRPEGTVESFEEWLSGFGGRWLAILVDGSHRRLYLDSNGTMSAVYETETGRAASTTGLLLPPPAYLDRFRAELYEHLDIPGMGWFPGGLTAHSGVHRLMCNFYLDLDRWTPVRHWPKEAILPSENHAELLQSITDNTTRCMRALSERFSCIQSLTAGYESRFLLACARHLATETKTFQIVHRSGDIDLIVAQRLSKMTGVPLQTIPAAKATPEEEERWRFLAGHCVGGSNAVTHPSKRSLAGYDLMLLGNAGEFCRAFFWKPSDTSRTAITADLLSRRLGLPPSPLVTRYIQEWIEPLLDTQDALAILDLAYVELRMSCWAYAQAYASTAPLGISPMTSGMNVRAMLSVPPEWKRGNRFIRELTAHQAPDLAQVPFNRIGDWRDLWLQLRNLLDAQRTRSRLQKLLAR